MRIDKRSSYRKEKLTISHGRALGSKPQRENRSYSGEVVQCSPINSGIREHVFVLFEAYVNQPTTNPEEIKATHGV